MTHEQSNRESQEAAKIRESMLAQIYGKVQDVMSGPLADIRRRVVEEPWYGKTIFDVVHDRQNQGTFWGNDRDPKLVDQEPGQKRARPGRRKKPAGTGNGGHYGKLLR